MLEPRDGYRFLLAFEQLGDFVELLSFLSLLEFLESGASALLRALGVTVSVSVAVDDLVQVVESADKLEGLAELYLSSTDVGASGHLINELEAGFNPSTQKSQTPHFSLLPQHPENPGKMLVGRPA